MSPDGEFHEGENVSDEGEAKIEAVRRSYLARRRFRTALAWLAAISLAAAAAAVAWWRWPRTERWLTVPVSEEDGGFDLARYVIDMPSPSHGIAAVVDYPKDARMKVLREDPSGLEVETFTGSARDVPFRISFERRIDPEELNISSTDSVELAKRRMSSSRTVAFLSGGSSIAQGFRFMEDEYPHSCGESLLERGTPFWMGEFCEDSGGMKWHGVLIILRDGDAQYILERSIPESEWPRGMHLLREDPNMAFSPAFLAKRWESPGREFMDLSYGFDRLCALAEEGLALANPFPSLWPLVRRRIDALMALSWHGSRRDREKAASLLSSLRAKEDILYSTLKARYDISRLARNRAGMRSAYAALSSVFGGGRFDRRRVKIYSPEVFP